MINMVKGVACAVFLFAWNTRTRLHLRASWMQNSARWNIDPCFTITAFIIPRAHFLLPFKNRHFYRVSNDLVNVLHFFPHIDQLFSKNELKYNKIA